jgi:hypothetical protein
MAPKAKLSLEEFLGSYTGRVNKGTCFVCLLAERVDIDTALREKVPATPLARWLRARGYTEPEGALTARINNHKTRGHHEG